jgi:RimJ/RimL family protein N-acetyltransferase
MSLEKGETVSLREVVTADLEVFFVNQLDPEANWLAAFVPRDPRDRAAFDAHWAKILAAPRIVNRTIVADGRVAGNVACYPQGDEWEVTYWLGREFWGRGVATRALAQLLAELPRRPIVARAAVDNIGSLKVLQKCGFMVVGRDRGFAAARGGEIEEYLLRLER